MITEEERIHVKNTLALMNCMIKSGEQHSSRSNEMLTEAFSIVSLRPPAKLQERDLLNSIENGSEAGRDKIMRLLSIRGNLAKELLKIENTIDATMEELCITYRRIDKELKELIG